MAIFISRGCFVSDAVKGVTPKPEARREAAATFEAAGKAAGSFGSAGRS